MDMTNTLTDTTKTLMYTTNTRRDTTKINALTDGLTLQMVFIIFF